MTPVSPETQYMTVQLAAQFSGISEGSLRNRIARGELPAKRLGKRILIERQVLEHLIRSDTATTST